MDLLKLQAMGAFVPRDLVKRTIELEYFPPLPADQWADPAVPEFASERVKDTADVWVRKRNSADFLEIVQASDADKPFVTILRSLCNPDGSQLFADIEQVKSLAEWLLVPLINVVTEVNTHSPKKQTPRTTSGARSRSPSAGGRSGSGSTRSSKKSGRSG